MRFFFLLCLSIVAFPALAQLRYHVDAKATGAQTGQTWADAFTDLQQALAAADPGDTIWVAAGTYKPTSSTDRTASFVLVDGVHLLGGFFGAETSATQRDIEQHPTILSGDIGLPGVLTDNSYHVVRGKGLGEGTLLDGFFIRDGYSYNEFTPTVLDRYGAGLLLEGAAGVADSRPVIQHCFFENNRANEGGALCITWIDFGNPSLGQNPVNPVLRNCTFSRNRASLNGGAVCKYGPAIQDTFYIEDCRFLDNTAFGSQGGGIFFHTQINSNLVVRGCLFERDTSWGNGGGAIALPSTLPDSSAPTLLLDACVFRKNLALEGAAFFFDGLMNNPGIGLVFTFRIQNCNFDENVARAANGSVFYLLGPDGVRFNVSVEDCVIQNNRASNITMQITFYEFNESYLNVSRCIFINNKARSGPNGLCMVISNGGGKNNTVTTDINNCLFYHNGGGIAMTSGARNYSTTRVTNCTFFENNKYTFIKTWDTLFNQPNGYFNNFYIDNCIVWEPATDLRKAFYNNEPLESNMYGYYINHTLLSLSDSTSVPGGQEAFEEGNIWGKYPDFQDTAAANFRLRACSPAVDAGNNLAVLGGTSATDLDGLPRIQFGRVDLGAYEQADSCIIINTGEVPYWGRLAIQPNPSEEGVLGFALPVEASGEGILRIFDARGKLLVQRSENFTTPYRLHLEHLPPGFYTVRLQLAGKELAGKWIRL